MDYYEEGIYHFKNIEDWAYIVDLLNISTTNGHSKEEIIKMWYDKKEAFCARIYKKDGIYMFLYSSIGYYECLSLDIIEFENKSKYVVDLL